MSDRIVCGRPVKNMEMVKQRSSKSLIMKQLDLLSVEEETSGEELINIYFLLHRTSFSMRSYVGER